MLMQNCTMNASTYLCRLLHIQCAGLALCLIIGPQNKITCETTLPLYTCSICGRRLVAKLRRSSGLSRMNWILSWALVGTASCSMPPVPACPEQQDAISENASRICSKPSSPLAEYIHLHGMA